MSFDLRDFLYIPFSDRSMARAQSCAKLQGRGSNPVVDPIFVSFFLLYNFPFRLIQVAFFNDSMNEVKFQVSFCSL